MSTQQETQIVGSFIQDRDADFKAGFTRLHDAFVRESNLNPIHDLGRILSVNSFKESYKDYLLGDVLEEAAFGDEYFDLLPQKIEQLFENTQDVIVQESNMGTLLPIVGYSLPILKKSFLKCHAKDIVMTEVPTEPIVKVVFERKFLKDKAGNKYFIPDVFYSEEYKEVMQHGLGTKISDKWYPEATDLPLHELNIMEESGGSLQFRDSLGNDFVIDSAIIDVNGVDVTVEGLEIRPNKATGGTFGQAVTAKSADGLTTATDFITGGVDFYSGVVSVACTGGKVKKVKFGGHLSNQNNIHSLEFDRQRESREWEIIEQARFNTGFTVERIKDMKALSNIDVMSETIADMAETMTQYEDSSILTFLDDSFNKWKDRKDIEPFGYKGGFVETAEFDMIPPTNVYIPTSQWAEQLRWYFNRQFRRLSDKLRTQDIMYVIYANPAHIELLQDEVNWVINEDTKVGGIQLEYKFGVLTKTQVRVHVVSSMKVDRDLGFRIVAYPTTKDHITFKHYKYSMNIANDYRNPNTPNIPNIMGTSRFLTTELLPLQGQMKLLNDDFGRTTK